MAENKINVGGRLHSIATGNVLVGADEIFDDEKNKKQNDINTETYSLVNNINEILNSLSPDQQSALNVATKATNNEAKLSYYVCNTEGNVAAKVISDATGYVLSLGGSIKVKMTNVNTADNATLNINSTGAKSLYYDGERASANNTWKAGETVEVYYDGTSYYANSVAGGTVTSARIKDGAVTINKLEPSIQSLITNISKNASFAGIATPTTNPGIPGGPMFYISTEKGTYTNFGGIEVTDDEVVILHYDTTWHKIATGIASKDKVTELESEVYPLVNEQTNNLSSNNIIQDKYRTINGTLATLSSYFYSNPILLHKGDSITASITDGVTNTVAVLSVVDINNNWISLIQRGATPLEVSYTATDDIYISISALISQLQSFNINRIATITRMQINIDDNTAKIEQNTSNVSVNTKSIQKIEKSLESVSYQLDTDDRIAGKYRVITGNLTSSNAYFYTNPIKLHKGDKIIITDANIVTAVSIISEVDSNNNFISVIYAGQGAVASHTFIAPRDMFIGLSALESQAGTITIETCGVFQRFTANEEDIKDLQEVLTNTTRGLDTTDVVTGKYRTISGSLATMSAYFYSNPILLHKGDKIVTTSEITLTPSVSLISKVDAENNFDSVLKAGSGSAEIIDYTMAEDTYISISALDNQRSLLVIYQNGIESQIVSLVADVANVSPAADTKLPAITDNPLSSIRRDAGYGSIIRKWGIIGDSLSSGEMQCYDNTSTSSSDYKFLDMYQYSWGQVFARLIGADVYNFSNGGQTTWGWLKGQGFVHDNSYIGGIGGGDWNLAKQDAYKKDAYIIALGVNDRLKIANGEYVLGTTSQIVSYDGTNSDIDDTSVNPKSFVRYYAGIIQRVKSIQPKAKIFCVTPLGSNYAEIAQAIRDIVEYYSSDGIYLIDLFNYIPRGYNVNGYMLNGHLSSMGYAYTAYMMNTYIDWIIRNNGSAFRDTALIGTKYRPDY